MNSIFQIIFILVSFSVLILLLSFVSKIKTKPENSLAGDKAYILNRLSSLAKNCFEKNFGTYKSVICYELNFKCTENVKKDDIINSLKDLGFKVKADDLGKEGKIVIRYENETIYISKVEYERVSS